MNRRCVGISAPCCGITITNQSRLLTGEAGWRWPSEKSRILAGPPGIYTVLGSTNLAAWSALSTAINELGSVLFTDPDSNLPPQKFYRVLQDPPPPRNMVLKK